MSKQEFIYFVLQFSAEPTACLKSFLENPEGKKPRCHPITGHFEKVQCRDGYCFCVEPKLGAINHKKLRVQQGARIFCDGK